MPYSYHLILDERRNNDLMATSSVSRMFIQVVKQTQVYMVDRRLLFCRSFGFEENFFNTMRSIISDCPLVFQISTFFRLDVIFASVSFHGPPIVKRIMLHLQT